MYEPRLVAFEAFVGLRGLFWLERIEVANTVATQAAVKARATRLRAKKLTCHRRQVVHGQQQHLSEFNDDSLLRRCQRRLQAVPRVRGVIKVVPALQLVGGALTDAVALGKRGSRVRAGRNLCANDRCGRCIFMQGDQHGKAAGWMVAVTLRLSINSRMTSLAMNRGYRFLSM